jgi:hypothetical protein
MGKASSAGSCLDNSSFTHAVGVASGLSHSYFCPESLS